MRQTKVAIIYKYIPQYRQDFFSLLRERLSQAGIELILVYGQPALDDATKKEAIDIEWATKIHNTFFSVAGKTLYWQPVFQSIKNADLVIVEQASKLLVNYILVGMNIMGINRLAFWGHGKNLQAQKQSTVGEWLKRRLSNKVHWWFAYTESSAEIVEFLGYPRERITIVNNAIDTRKLSRIRQDLTNDKIEQVRKELVIKPDAQVCLFVGGMYPEKRLDFLLQACHIIREKLPSFEMIFIGAGTDQHLVESAAKQPWIHYVGPKFGSEKVQFFAISKAFLLPGIVGLAILDCFALETPLITTNISGHGPEIEYLQHNQNGIMISDPYDVMKYSQAVIELLVDENRRSELVVGCRTSAQKYTVEDMVERFAAGIENALQ